MVHISEVTNVMNRMMQVNIFHPSEKQRMVKDEEKTFLDPNVVMDARHRAIREDSDTSIANESILAEAKRLLTQEEATQLYMEKQQRYLERELKRFELEVSKTRPKFLKLDRCSRRNLAPSDDEEFWGTARKFKSKIIVEENREPNNGCKSQADPVQTNTLIETDKHLSVNKEDEKYLSKMEYELPRIGSIKVTIKDKINNETDAERLHLLRKYYDLLKEHTTEQRRLREIKIKIQQNMTAKVTRKYFDIWRKCAMDAKQSVKKQVEEISEERRIEMFIDAITERQRELMKSRKPKARIGNLSAKESNNGNVKKKNAYAKTIVVESPAQSRLNAQKKIIEQQKAKLAEQNRLIEELRLEQMRKEICQANTETMKMARETLTHCGQKTRISLVQLMHQNGYRDESLMVPRQESTAPKFLLRMEARAEARRRRVQLYQELRRQKLEEQKRNEELARIEEEQKKKRLQQEVFAEARRLRKDQEENRRRENETFQRLNGMADEFYRKYLLQRYIMEPFSKILQEKRINEEKAKTYCRGKLLKKVFTMWRIEAESQCRIKVETATSFYNKKLLSGIMEQWKQLVKEMNSKDQVATDFHEMKHLEKYFKLWLVRIIENRAENEKMGKFADSIYEDKLKMNYFSNWKKYLAIVEDIKESERRKDELRLLVQELIPDFNPKERGVMLEDWD